MIITITGGSGSGKSALGEAMACRLQSAQKYYIATMETTGSEAKTRIAKHCAQRAGKNFQTLECPTNLAALNLPENSTALLECISNLTANEIFSANGCGLTQTQNTVISGVKHLAAYCQNLIIITNEIFADGIDYDQTTTAYIKTLGLINQELAQISDIFVESVYSVPLLHKGVLPWQLSNL